MSSEPADGPWPFPPPCTAQFEHRGITCAVVRVAPFSVLGVLLRLFTTEETWHTGYVCLPPGHPWETIEAAPADVYGGISFRHVDPDGRTWLGWDTLPIGPERREIDPEAETRRLADQVVSALVDSPKGGQG